MSDTTEQYVLSVMSGQRRGWAASVLRGLLGAAEPVYSAAVRVRNAKFDTGRGVRSLPRPVISVGNITVGGTGKTPVVRWLCEHLRARGMNPAVLMRGYKSINGISDEQTMLRQSLNVPGQVPLVVHANPNRLIGGADVLREHPFVDVFVLDDGFQHRRLARDFDLVLISATDPFGFDHVHPRGLLREPLAGLKRVDAIVITRADEVDAPALAEIERRIRIHQPTAPIYRANHVQTGFRSATGVQPMDRLATQRVFAFCGLGNPNSFFQQVARHAAALAGSRAFPDHHAYSDADVAAIDRAAGLAQADLILTSEKDWVKMSGLPVAVKTSVPVGRVEMEVRFIDSGDAKLLSQVLGKARLISPSAVPASPG